MPSFSFVSDKEHTHVELTKHNDLQCIVPEGFKGIQGDVNSRHSHLKWHYGLQTPFDLYRSAAHGFAFLIGEAIAENSNMHLSAERLFGLISEHKDEATVKLSRFSGFFAWIVVLNDETVYCGSDPFGLFPIYYFHSKNSLSIATSLRALHDNPEYNQAIDPIGFCRYLLENGCSSHRTLEKSGKRLNIAESIRYQPQSNQLNLTQHPYPGERASKTIQDLNEAATFSIEATHKAVERHTQRSADTCLLSGGLDSRQVLSIAHQLGHRPRCVTLGVQDSYEAINARKVTQNLKLQWECTGQFGEPAHQVVDDEIHLSSLGGGFNGLLFPWSQMKELRNTRCLTVRHRVLRSSFI